MPHLLHYAKSKCRTAAPPHAAQPILYALGKYFWEFSLFIC